MPQSHLFIIDAPESLNLALDSSLRLAFALSRKGHLVFASQVKDLSWASGSAQAAAKVSRIIFGAEPQSAKFDPLRTESLAFFSAIHMRKDPPFDLDYITSTWLLESVADKSKVYNHPAALRSLNEKLAIFKFPEAIRPALASCSPENLLEFLKSKADGDAVLKPLHQYGGRGVIRVQLGTAQLKTDREVLDLFRAETDNGKQLRLIQAFDKSIFEGEVRAFYVGGKPLAWCLKRPAKGEFLANTRSGATLETYTPTTQDLERVGQVAKELQKQGVDIVGFDLLGGFISEINLTSPRLLQAPGDNTPYYEQWADWTIRDCQV